MEPDDVQIASLRERIENYKQSRTWSRGEMIAWCDALVTAAEAELERLRRDGSAPENGVRPANSADPRDDAAARRPHT